MNETQLGVKEIKHICDLIGKKITEEEIGQWSIVSNEGETNELIAAFDESRGHFVMVNKEDAVWDDAIREYVVIG